MRFQLLEFEKNQIISRVSDVKNNLGGKQYSSQSEDRKKNDEVIMESAKKLIGGVLLTEDKNLLVR